MTIHELRRQWEGDKLPLPNYVDGMRQHFQAQREVERTMQRIAAKRRAAWVQDAAAFGTLLVILGVAVGVYIVS